MWLTSCLRICMRRMVCARPLAPGSHAWVLLRAQMADQIQYRRDVRTALIAVTVAHGLPCRQKLHHYLRPTHRHP